ncbi:MAG: hypothetical protein J3K34DRAFT_419009 [Monoraphidium minutum]|nr:MAG: hypothetical protein J3K34DRAFT_419009 [Monoraphidium minutum]
MQVGTKGRAEGAWPGAWFDLGRGGGGGGAGVLAWKEQPWLRTQVEVTKGRNPARSPGGRPPPNRNVKARRRRRFVDGRGLCNAQRGLRRARIAQREAVWSVEERDEREWAPGAAPCPQTLPKPVGTRYALRCRSVGSPQRTPMGGRGCARLPRRSVGGIKGLMGGRERGAPGCPPALVFGCSVGGRQGRWRAGGAPRRGRLKSPICIRLSPPKL